MWVVSNLRHFVPRQQLIQYYKSNLNAIIQYGVLVYGCTSFSFFTKNTHPSEKKLKFLHCRKRFDHSEDIFVTKRIITLYELHLYEILKLVLRSLNNLHSQNFSNNSFSFEKPKINRSHSLRFLNEPLCKTLILKDVLLDIVLLNYTTF